MCHTCFEHEATNEWNVGLNLQLLIMVTCAEFPKQVVSHRVVNDKLILSLFRTVRAVECVLSLVSFARTTPSLYKIVIINIFLFSWTCVYIHILYIYRYYHYSYYINGEKSVLGFTACNCQVV